MRRRFRVGMLGLGVLVCVGCGTTKSTDTARSATEMLLISDAVDKAVDDLNFRPLHDQKVFVDTQYLDGAVDKGYLVSSIRQSLATSGAMLQEKADTATYVVEMRSGCVGTDRYSMLIGVPQMNVPVSVPGVPSAIPEIPIVKKTDQLGVAKIGVFVYHRESGRAVWQSGTQKGGSSAKDTWVLGAGPIRNGSVNSEEETKLAGIGVSDLNPFGEDEDPEAPNRVSVTASTDWKFADQQPAKTRIASETKPEIEIVPVSGEEVAPPPPPPPVPLPE